MCGLAPGIALLRDEVGEVHATVAQAALKVEEGLGSPIEIKDSLQPVAGPLDRGDTLRFRTLMLGVALGQRRYVVDKHCVENAVFVPLLRAITSVKIAGDALVLKDYGPGNGRRVAGEKGSARGERERLHISHDTLEDAAMVAVCRVSFVMAKKTREPVADGQMRMRINDR